MSIIPVLLPPGSVFSLISSILGCFQWLPCGFPPGYVSSRLSLSVITSYLPKVYAPLTVLLYHGHDCLTVFLLLLDDIFGYNFHLLYHNVFSSEGSSSLFVCLFVVGSLSGYRTQAAVVGAPRP